MTILVFTLYRSWSMGVYILLAYFRVGVIIANINSVAINIQVRFAVNCMVLICVLTKCSTQLSPKV